MVNSDDPIGNEKKIPFGHVEKRLHFDGEYALLNEELYGELKERMISVSTDGRLIRETHLRAGKTIKRVILIDGFLVALLMQTKHLQSYIIQTLASLRLTRLPSSLFQAMSRLLQLTHLPSSLF